jgi:hypothetical protein
VPALPVPLISKRREVGLILQKVQHVAPAAALLVQGASRLTHEGHGWSLLLGIAELGTSLLVIGAFARQIRAARTRAPAAHDEGAGHGGDAHHGVDWVDLFLGAMLGVEVWAHWHETGHVKRPTVLLAAAMFAIGLLHGRIAAFGQRRRGLWIDDDGLRLSGRPFRRFTARWTELAAIDLTPAEARLVRRDGIRIVVDLADLRNAAEVRAALEAARLRLPPAALAPEPAPPSPAVAAADVAAAMQAPAPPPQ